MPNKVTLSENDDGSVSLKGNELLVQATHDDAAAVRGGAPHTQRTLVKFSADVIMPGGALEEVGQLSFKQSEKDNVIDGRLGGELYIGLRIPGMGSTDAAMQDVLRAYPKDTHPDYPGGAFVFEVPVVAPGLSGGRGGTNEYATGISSRNGRYRLQAQDDGNLVYYDYTFTPPKVLAVLGSKQGDPPVQNGPPPPLGTGVARVIPVTIEADGAFAPRMMSDRANAVVFGEMATVFAGSRDTGGPVFFRVDLASDQVTRLESMLVPYRGETEFWYWLPDGTLIIGSGAQLHRVNPFRGDDEVVLDIGTMLPGHTLDQWHSSDDGSTHSATVKDASWQKVGTVTIHHGKQEYWPAQGVLDESQVSRNGRYVLIKERGDDNRIIDLDTRVTTWIPDLGRAVGHSDMGPDYVVGEADKPDPGGMVIWHLDRLNEGPRFLVPSLNMGYVSTRAGRCLWSGDEWLSLVDLEDGHVTPLVEHGGTSDYDGRVKANLSPCGRVATFMVDGQVKLLILP